MLIFNFQNITDNIADLETFRLTDGYELYLFGYSSALTYEEPKRMRFIGTSRNKTSRITRALKINVLVTYPPSYDHCTTVAKSSF